MTLSVVLITKNEEDNIEACLNTVKWADEVIVVDSGSTDQTLKRAERQGAKIHSRTFDNFASQKNAAIALAEGPWILLLDADERVTSDLAREIRQVVAKNPLDTLYEVKRANYFFGKRLRFSGTQKDYQPRLFPKGKARLTQPVHERMVTELPRKKLKNIIIHYSTQSFAHYRQKLACYLPYEVEVLSRKGHKRYFFDMLFRPVAKFAELYFFKAGILDGLTGLQYAFLSSCYVFFKYRQYGQTMKTNQILKNTPANANL